MCSLSLSSLEKRTTLARKRERERRDRVKNHTNKKWWWWLSLYESGGNKSRWRRRWWSGMRSNEKSSIFLKQIEKCLLQENHVVLRGKRRCNEEGGWGCCSVEKEIRRGEESPQGQGCDATTASTTTCVFVRQLLQLRLDWVSLTVAVNQGFEENERSILTDSRHE